MTVGLLTRSSYDGHDTLVAYMEYDARYQRIFLSTDDGTSWHDTKRWTPFIGTTIVSSDGMLIHCCAGMNFGDSAGVYFSNDLGLHWEKRLSGFGITKVIEAKKNQYYAVSYNSKRDTSILFLSIDTGLSWVGLTSYDGVHDIIGRRNGDLYLAYGVDLLRSTNLGASWDKVFTCNNTSYNFITGMNGNESLIFFNDYQGNFYTSQTGNPNSWTLRRSIGGNSISSKACYHRGVFFLADLLSLDTGNTWLSSPTNLGLPYPYYTIQAESLDSNGRYFFSTGDYISYSSDSGKVWDQRIPLTKDSTLLPILPLASMGDSMLLIFDGANVYMSSDNGTSWDQSYQYQNYFYIITSLATSENSLLLGIEDTNYDFCVATTTDRGASWVLTQPIPSGGEILFVVESLPHYFVAIDVNGICNYSADNGATWNNSSIADTSVFITAFNAVTQKKFYAASKGAFYVSTDSGTSWITHPLPSPGTVISMMGMNGSNSIIAIFGSTSLYRSTDDGFSWSEWDIGIPSGTIIHSVVNTDDGTTYAGTEKGVFSLLPNATSWEMKSSGLSDIKVLSMTTQGKTLVVSCANTGIFTTSNIASVGSSDVIDQGLSIYPNPTISDVTIHYKIHKSENSKLYLADQLGRVVSIINDGFESEGVKSILYSTKDIPAGMYFLFLDGKGSNFVTKLIIKK
jgi:photosystem II stability/assembly factor-like uncharacterized protein